ncbi:MAG TPA: three-Cys-motif partner protein TcmP [Anaerovoracaceae bacterium]|nr:three-Cys-motif partner protein TcmP [Anaerovoracaceae bacterium]
MSTPTDALWEIEPHTLAKHEILRRYLGAWFAILGKYNPRVVYIDGFCGPGRYKGGEKGSPIIALESALKHQMHQLIQEATFIFIDENQERIDHLKSEINALNIPPCFHVGTEVNQFDSTLNGILDQLDARGSQLAPTFAFIDPFGFKGAPYKLIERLLKNQKTEIFINIMADSINRFLEHPDPQITQHITSLYGTPKVQSIIHSTGDRVKQLRELYQEQLKRIAKFVRYFEMRDENNRLIYYLFFATKNRLGHVKMKEAFWKVDPSTGLCFSDRTDPLQPVLFNLDPSLDLGKELLKKFSGQKTNVYSLRIFVEDETAYIASHMREALKRLEDQGQINIEPMQQNGKKRRKHMFPDEVILTFPILP